VFNLKKYDMEKNGKKNSGKKTLNSALLLLLVASVVAVSGCIANFGGTQNAEFSILPVITSTQDLILKGEAVPQEVRSGKDLEMAFEIDALRDLRGISFAVTDSCLFSGDSGTFERQELKANRSTSFRMTMTAGGTDLGIGCRIKFKTAYSSTLLAKQDIIVLDDAEFIDEQRTGGIGAKSPKFDSTSNSLQVSFAFSDPQPFENDVNEFMYIDYSNVGPGILDSLKAGSVQFTAPSNVKMTCDDYAAQGNSFVLNRDLTFMEGRAKKSTCKLLTKANQPSDLETLQITANYNYMIENEFDVKIKPR
jgi:hypothetical protein